MKIKLDHKTEMKERRLRQLSRVSEMSPIYLMKGEELRNIRKRKTNFKGEIQR